MGKTGLTKIAVTLISLLIAAGVIFCAVGLIMSWCHGTGFAEEISSWFGIVEEVVENPEETEEVLTTAVHSIASFFKLG